MLHDNDESPDWCPPQVARSLFWDPHHWSQGHFDRSLSLNKFKGQDKSQVTFIDPQGRRSPLISTLMLQVVFYPSGPSMTVDENLKLKVAAFIPLSFWHSIAVMKWNPACIFLDSIKFNCPKKTIINPLHFTKISIPMQYMSDYVRLVSIQIFLIQFPSLQKKHKPTCAHVWTKFSKHPKKSNTIKYCNNNSFRSAAWCFYKRRSKKVFLTFWISSLTFFRCPVSFFLLHARFL